MWQEQLNDVRATLFVPPQVLTSSLITEQTHADVDPRFLMISASESTKVYFDDTLEGNRPFFI